MAHEHIPYDGALLDRLLRITLAVVCGAGSTGAFSGAGAGERGVVVGGNYSEPAVAGKTVAITADGGATWRAGNAGGFRSAVIWLDSQSLLAVGSHGASRSSDGGRSWQPFGDVGFHCLSRARDGSVWASGSDGRVARLVTAR